MTPTHCSAHGHPAAHGSTLTSFNHRAGGSLPAQIHQTESMGVPTPAYPTSRSYPMTQTNLDSASGPATPGDPLPESRPAAVNAPREDGSPAAGGPARRVGRWVSAEEAVRAVKSGDTIVMGHACGEA